MNWLIGAGVLLLVLVVPARRRERLAGYPQFILMTLSGSLSGIALARSVVDGPSPLTLGMGALAMLFFGIEIVRRMRSARDRS